MAEQRPQVVVPGQPVQPQGDEESVSQPAKLIRIASMIRELVEEVRQSSLDEAGRSRLADIYHNSIEELKESLSEDLRRELDKLALPLESKSSEAEIRVAQAQLLGWLEGLFHGIQAALWAQHMQAQAALEEMRRRQLPPGAPGPPGAEPGEPPGPGRPGQYL
ncbi:MAG: bacterial proteasome activator family protein [Actinomycetota bacterium]|nr:bacterial proteasome activator family protein [Actinomycetota bacterium]